MAVDTSPANHVVEQVECPAENQRKAVRNQPVLQKRVEVDADGTWHINGYDEARQILRNHFVRQAGFRADLVLSHGTGVMKNLPILYLEGDEHHRMRSETNKFFTPTITDRQYRDFMSEYADELVNRLRKDKRADLNHLTMEMAVRVTAEVVGLTNSIFPGLSKRVNALLEIGGRVKAGSLLDMISIQRYVVSFLFFDVKPAARARRKEAKNDVISYLVSRNYSDIEILTECIVYGVAGMATTREFICVAMWHLLNNPHLRQRMLVGSQEERYAILHEILRLEPMIGHIFRQTTGEVQFESEGQTLTIPANTRVDLNIYASNIDTEMAGENSAAVCPMRPLTSKLGKVPEPALSFGDGYHRCPGAYIAIQESDIFIRKLLEIETLRIEREPDVNYNETVSGYEIRNFKLVVD